MQSSNIHHDGAKPLIIDIHTHIYPPSYVELLRKRKSVPYIRSFDDSENLRLIILPGEDDPQTPSTARGRPLGPEYYDVDKKIAFMDAHNITTSIVSLANPWLDFLPPSEAAAAAQETNDALNDLCAKYPSRLYAFGALPLSGPISAIVAEIHRLKTLPHMRGVIMGTSGLGAGLDDPTLDAVWAALQATRTIPFIHPHYGLPSSVYGPRASDYGHILPLALGFPLETTIAVARMFLAGVWERFAELDVLLAHSGGVLPFLAGRIESCIAHDAHYRKAEALAGTSRVDLWTVLRERVYLDAVIYSEVGLKAAVEAQGAEGVGRVMFGTDHPFFPPPATEGKQKDEWLSVTLNRDAIQSAFPEQAKRILGANAAKVFDIPL